MEKDLQNIVKKISEPIVRQSDLFLVDVEIKHNKVPEVWVLVDSETEGVNIDACSEISKAISFEIESQELFKNPYRLNVSSPGLGRPLTDRRQFAKNLGRNARVKYAQGNEYITVEGILKKVEDNGLALEFGGNSDQQIDFENVVEVKIIPKI